MLFLIWYMAVVLPFIIFKEGYKKYIAKHIPEDKFIWRLPYVLIIFLSFALLILLIGGYR